MGARIGRQIETRFAFVFLTVSLIILYGSLYPFDFRLRPYDGNPIDALLASIHRRAHYSDLIANLLLYLPLGYFAVQALSRKPALWTIPLFSILGGMFSTSIELAQYYDAGRNTTIYDVFANTAGTFLGAIAGLAFHSSTRSNFARRLRERPLVVMLLACWLGYRLFPYVPVIDLHAYWSAVKPILDTGLLSWVDVFRHVAIWLCLALLLQTLITQRWSRAAFVIFAGTIEVGRVLIGTHLSPAEVAGAAIAALVWAIIAGVAARATVILLVFVVMVVMQALEPFQFEWQTPQPFEWVPFEGFLNGALSVNIMSFFEKSFTYGALVWLAIRAGYRYRHAVLGAIGLVSALRFCQIYLPSRSAEITDVIILIVMAGLIKMTREDSQISENSVTSSNAKRET